MFSRILIANRGEIALRIVRACNDLGIETVAVYSEADRDALHLRYVTDAICIGPGPAAGSYLDISKIISAAEIADVEAIHPGYGFLAENAHFAEVCESCRIKFIGPSAEAMRLVGNKAEARRLARKAGLPMLAGSEGSVKDEQEALDVAKELGYPVMLKAAAGGGGRGMRVARNDVSLVQSFLAAQAEADAAFGDASIYLEKLEEKARHVEMQILVDSNGKAIHLGERDCTVQRRHQKLIEEAPSPAVSPKLRNAIGDAAIKFARTAGYANAGTVEFLLDPKGKYHFIEMNARMQVEHPVTEMVTGIDLIREQLRIAAGEPLEYSQKQVQFRGAAIECRINAEDPGNGFRPTPGRISAYYPPGGPGVRLDSHVYAGYTIPAHYDSLIGKLIAHAPTREQAIQTMRRALSEYYIEGVTTTIPLCLSVIQDADFMRGEFDTNFLEGFFKKAK